LNCQAGVTGGEGLSNDISGSRDDNELNNDLNHPHDVAQPLRRGVEPHSTVEPCGSCAQCDRIARGIHADVSTITVLPPEDGVQHKDISVDQIREVEQMVSLAPFEGRRRVVIIDPADDMSIGAQNAFLKTLEDRRLTTFVLIAS
jgi:DNA polymerase III delta prime subunit